MFLISDGFVYNYIDITLIRHQSLGKSLGVGNEYLIEFIIELGFLLEVGKELKDLGEATWVFDEEVVLEEVLDVDLIHDQGDEVFVFFHYLV